MYSIIDNGVAFEVGAADRDVGRREYIGDVASRAEEQHGVLQSLFLDPQPKRFRLDAVAGDQDLQLRELGTQEVRGIDEHLECLLRAELTDRRHDRGFGGDPELSANIRARRDRCRHGIRQDADAFWGDAFDLDHALAVGVGDGDEGICQARDHDPVERRANSLPGEVVARGCPALLVRDHDRYPGQAAEHGAPEVGPELVGVQHVDALTAKH